MLDAATATIMLELLLLLLLPVISDIPPTTLSLAGGWR